MNITTPRYSTNSCSPKMLLIREGNSTRIIYMKGSIISNAETVYDESVVMEKVTEFVDNPYGRYSDAV